MAAEPDYMARALELARQNVAAGGGPFGAVVVVDGRIAGEGTNHVTAGNDPTAHAEIVAIRNACARLQTFHLEGATIYCTCEPCPMCLAAVLWARLFRLIYAAGRADAAAVGFDDAAFYRAVCASPGERSIPESRSHIAEAQELMRSWLGAPNRRPY